jgi:topoisomerase-4 subunit A
LRILSFEKDFSEIAIRGRGAMGNLLTKSEVHKITLKEKGVSTLGGRKVWFDSDVLRLNYDERGIYLGEFHGEDRILVILKNGDYYTSNFDLTQHFSSNILKIEKFNPEKVWTAALFDADQKYSYLKRFTFEDSERTVNFMGDNPDSSLYLLSDVYYSRIKVNFGGEDEFRDPLELDADEFIGIKSYRAKGKRMSNYEVASVEELEPLRFPEVKEEEVLGSKKIEISLDDEESDGDDVQKSQDDDRDEINGQMKLF